MTPRECQPRKDSILVWLHSGHQGLKGFEMTGLDGSQPSIKLCSRALTDQVQQCFHQLRAGFQLWACSSQLSEGLLLLCFQICFLAEKEPGGLVRGESQEEIGLAPG